MDEVYEDILVAVHRAGRPVSRLEIELLVNKPRGIVLHRCRKLVAKGILRYDEAAARYVKYREFPRGPVFEIMEDRVDRRRKEDPLRRPDAFGLMVEYGDGFSYELRQEFLRQLVRLCSQVENCDPDSLGEVFVPSECSPEVALVYRRAHEVVSDWLVETALADDFAVGAVCEDAGLGEEPPDLGPYDDDEMPDEVLATLEPEYLDDE